VTFDRYERIARLPVTVLSFVMVPVILVPLVVHLSGATATAFDIADYAGWVLFALDYSFRVTLVPDRREYIRRHLFDLLIVILWVLPLVSLPGAGRALHLGQVVKLAGFLGSGIQHAGGLLRRWQERQRMTGTGPAG
jgi:voltage-gated potassium channel